MEMMIAWKSISIEAKLISGASCVSWRSRLGHYPKDLWWTSLISIECALLYSKIYYGSLARLRRITIYIQVVEKSWSMWTPNSILKYTIVIIFMASLFWKIPKLTLNFWWYSFKYCAKTKVAHRNSEMTIFRPDHLRLIPSWKVSEQRFTFMKLFIVIVFRASVKTISGANFTPVIYGK